jgi:hypothetical protein
MYRASGYISWKEKTCTLDVKAEAFWQLAKCQLFDKAARLLLTSLHTLLKQRQKSSTFLAFSVNTVVHNPATCGADPNLRIPKISKQKLNIQIRSGSESDSVFYNLAANKL